LDFDETVSFTVAGYKDDLSLDNIFEKRIKQISSYTYNAHCKNIEWAL
jgi:hypothetical protein